VVAETTQSCYSVIVLVNKDSMLSYPASRRWNEKKSTDQEVQRDGTREGRIMFTVNHMVGGGFR